MPEIVKNECRICKSTLTTKSVAIFKEMSFYSGISRTGVELKDKKSPDFESFCLCQQCWIKLNEMIEDIKNPKKKLKPTPCKNLTSKEKEIRKMLRGEENGRRKETLHLSNSTSI